MLMAKAETDSVGVLVSGGAYRPEYAQLRGMMNELQKTAADKNCKFTSGAQNLDGDVENEPNANEPNANEPSDRDIYGLPGERAGGRTR
jgi:hypothetical protein